MRAAGVRLQDEPRAAAITAIKDNYADADVLAVIETEKQNLDRLLAEEIKTVRENNQLQIDFALLSIADDNKPMALTYVDEAVSRIHALGYSEGPRHVRMALEAEFGSVLRRRELQDRRRRIEKVEAGQVMWNA